nr:hypothetical protein [Tanacetum cinerariifolium]
IVTFPGVTSSSENSSQVASSSENSSPQPVAAISSIGVVFRENIHISSWVKWNNILFDWKLGSLGWETYMPKNLDYLRNGMVFSNKRNDSLKKSYKDFYGEDGGFCSPSNNRGIHDSLHGIINVLSNIEEFDGSNEKDVDATTKIEKKKPLLDDKSKNLMQLH